ncbi:phosphoribosylamine--glycine ligase family protein [Sodalis-like endosymbiont of Proechinophthirus fluctus]|nr:phosphoribosylamine--glycine ligase family protein [Sodalis-like endosymbiont of Proechinophthirus fluctus]
MAWKAARSKLADNVHVLPGNAGCARWSRHSKYEYCRY